MSFTPEQLAEGLAEAERRGDHKIADAFRVRLGDFNTNNRTQASNMPNLEKWVDKCKKRFAHHRQGAQ